MERILFRYNFVFMLGAQRSQSLRQNINRRKPHKRSSPVEQRIRRNAHFMTIKVKVNIHTGSVHEAGVDVNLGNKNLRQKILRRFDVLLLEEEDEANRHPKWLLIAERTLR